VDGSDSSCAGQSKRASNPSKQAKDFLTEEGRRATRPVRDLHPKSVRAGSGGGGGARTPDPDAGGTACFAHGSAACCGGGGWLGLLPLAPRLSFSETAARAVELFPAPA